MRPLLVALTFCVCANWLGAQERFDDAAHQFPLRHDGPPRYAFHHFHEYLPALFERTLTFDEFEIGKDAVEWVFTGELGWVLVRLAAGRLEVAQSFHDSFGLDPIEAGQHHPMRHAQRTAVETSEDLAGSPRSVTVSMDHRLGLSVSVNGRETVRQRCLFDVSRHQLLYWKREGPVGKVRGRLLSPAVEETAIRVDPSRSHQIMLGFGGITVPTAWAELGPEARRRWWEKLAEYNFLLHREWPMGLELNPEMSNWDRMADASPTYYGLNHPNGQVSDVEYLQGVRCMGGKSLYEFWDIPLWARRDFTDSDGKRHPGAADPDKYAQAVVRYCRLTRDRAGAPPHIVGIQNEGRQPPEIYRAMTLKLRQALDAAGFREVKIHMQDAETVARGILHAPAFRQSEEVWKALDYSAVHMYDFQTHFTDPDSFDAKLAEFGRLTAGKPFLSTEISVNSDPYQIASYRVAFGIGQLYHKNLTILDAVGLLYCFLLVNVEHPSYGWTRTVMVPDRAHGFSFKAPSHQLRMLGAYSRRIREGMARVEARSSNPDVLVTAFAGKDGARTLVALNRSLNPQRLSVAWQGKPFRFQEVADPYHENAVTAVPGEIVVAPGAVLTLSTVELGRLRTTR